MSFVAVNGLMHSGSSLKKFPGQQYMESMGPNENSMPRDWDLLWKSGCHYNGYFSIPEMTIPALFGCDFIQLISSIPIYHESGFPDFFQSFGLGKNQSEDRVQVSTSHFKLPPGCPSSRFLCSLLWLSSLYRPPASSSTTTCKHCALPVHLRSVCYPWSKVFI